MRPPHRGPRTQRSLLPRAPEQDHLPVPLSRSWRVWSVIVGALIAAGAVIVIVVSNAEEDDFRPVPVEFEASTGGRPTITSLSVERDADRPDRGRVRVGGEGIIRVEIDGRGLCTSAVGAGGAWIEVDLCGELDSLTVTAYDIDDEAVAVTATVTG